MGSENTRRPVEGIEVRHSRTCRTENGGACNCRPSYRASVYSVRDGRKIRKTFGSLADAKGWRVDALHALSRGRLRAPVATTVAEAAEVFLAGARAGTVPSRGGGRYKPGTLRGYEYALEGRIIPALGHLKLSAVTRADVQDLADTLTAEGWSASTVANTLDPLRAIYRRAIQRDQVSVDPTANLELRVPKGGRVRIAGPAEAARLLAALPAFERALWATAMYAGLRRGELRALAWSDVDLQGRVIHVARGWDDVEGEQDGKSDAATRDVPILRPLGRELAAHRLACAWTEGLVFGRTAVMPFAKTSVLTRARTAWTAANDDRGPGAPLLVPIGLHESRHTCASTFIAAGANPKVIQRIMGHANITMTFDRYGHLMPGGLEEAANAADAFLAAEGVVG